ncbi:LytR/AlgR family response regulator transcription factor [Carnobacterium gallinarum]|uniref:LytR/AlgR family response regulator transcription factor n=1 Tax=Carnobacterium gallinarum TaxID=2749 RepID=UPI0006896327|nr:LytTR family DNA-binding domain-containing protein [Carnobacterium gallinarum]
MVDIYICEDNTQFAKLTEQTLNKLIRDYQLNFSINLVTKKPETLLTALTYTNEVGCYFLDIDLGEDVMSGLDLATEIRKIDPRGFIIFLTGDAHKFHHTFKYKIEALDYILKNDNETIEDRLLESLLAITDRNTTKYTHKESFIFSLNQSQFVIPFDEIIFFEVSSKAHRIVIHSYNRKIEFYSSLKEIQQQLDEKQTNFYRCHQSYLINLKNIKQFDASERIVHMTNGQQCEVAYRAIKKLKGVLNSSKIVNDKKNIQ